MSVQIQKAVITKPNQMEVETITASAFTIDAINDVDLVEGELTYQDDNVIGTRQGDVVTIFVLQAK